MSKFNTGYIYKFIIFLAGAAISLAAMPDEKPPSDVKAATAPAPVILPAKATRYIVFYSSLQLDFEIDPDSISIQPGPDGEVRYTLKATSKQGAINVSYEGIRCSNRQKIIYAVGQKNAEWSLSRSPEWSAIYIKGMNIQHAVLANGFFCSDSSVAGKVADIVSRLEWKKRLDEKY